ncbi:MAG: glycosyltransferase [Planctomycetota bacterium]|nr:glycosyltransferase [Planctomycetota bacterium]
MRICLVSSEVAPFVGGGLATYILEMARALLARGHEVHVLTQAFEGLPERGAAAAPGARFHAFDVNAGRAALPGAHYSFASRMSMAILDALRPLHEATPFDYIEFPEYQGQGYWSCRAKRTLGDFASAVLGVRLHTPLYLCREVDRTPTMDVEIAHLDHLERWSAGEADVVLGASAAMLERMRRDVAQASPRAGVPPFRLLRLPLDLSAWTRDVPEPARTDVPEIVFVGRTQLCKGAHVLAEAASMLLDRGHRLRVRFIGGDTTTGPFGRSMREHMDRRTPEAHREHLRYEGPVAREDLRRAIRGAAVVACPSLWDSYSYACIEAMALGACVVAGDGGSLPELVQHEVSGLVCRADDPGALADVLARALGDEGLRARLGAAASVRARELSDAGAIAQGLEAIVEAHRRDARAARPQETGPQETGPEGAEPRAAGRAGGVRTPDITVIIPFYNVGRFLPDTLDSLKRQTHADFDLLIINDGSTEPDSLALLDDLSRAGYTVLHKKNGGLGSARNHGFRHARTPWVVPIDGDDVAHPRFVELLYRAVRRDSSLACASCMFESFYETPGEAVSGYVPLAIDRNLLAYHNIGGPGAASILSREVVLGVGGYDEWLTSFEDWDLWCTLATRGYRGVAIPEFLLYYRLRPGSLIRSEALHRWHALKAYIIAKHPGLMARPDVTLRMQLAETYQEKERAHALAAEVESLRARLAALEQGGPAPMSAPPHDHVEIEVKKRLAENLRYRLADKVNDTIGALGVKRLAKDAAMGVEKLFRRG